MTGLYAVPYDTETEVGVTKAFPLGRWVHQQRKALRAGELEARRKELLDAPEAGMVWEPGGEAWENKLAALRSYQRATGHLAPRQDAVWGEGQAMTPIGQHMANLRRKGGLGKHPKRTEAPEADGSTRAAARVGRPGLELPLASRPVPRKAVETLPDGTETKLGIWYSNTKSRRDKLTAEQLDALRKLGVEWAV
ncbi:helicase associated domain-containing protein [Streptomyces sp. NPDC056304]|uniref:helicase associated domain-containing protein n=1 Tax=Streptomyces sp. NPDC056304 TaxID=3345778 RepID=UPI0035DB30CF